MPFFMRLLFLWTLLLPLHFVVLPANAAASPWGSWVEDLEVTASSMEIDEIELDSVERFPRFDREQVRVVLGKGQSTYGLTYRETAKGRASDPGKPERGLMLTAGHDWILSGQFRLNGELRVGLTGTNDHQPLYSEDTDLQANLVWFDADGLGLSDAYPSAYLGGIVNRFGRVQLIAGAGLWWKKLGAYVTGFHSLNGDDPQFNGVDFGQVNFAALQNSGFSVSATYEFKQLSVGLKQNFALDNGGNDLTLSLTVRHRLKRSMDS